MSLVAVFQIGSLGDSIVSVPALQSIREFVPDCTEYLLVSRFDTQLKVLPSHIFDMAWKASYKLNYQGPGRGLRQFGSIGSLLLKLRYYRPKHCVYLMPSDRLESQVERDRAFFKGGGVRNLIGFRALTTTERVAGANLDVRGTEAYLRFRRIWDGQSDEKFKKYAAAPLLHPSEAAQKRVAEWLKAKRRNTQRPLVAFCPYSNFPSRDLPNEVIVNVLAHLEKQAGAEVVIVGGNKDTQAAEAVIAQVGAGLNACGAFSVEESAAFLKGCKLAVCAESGPMHLAGAVGTPSVIVHSRINEELHRWFPVGNRNDHSILYRNVECAGCSLKICRIPDHPCIEKITTEQILSVTLARLDGSTVAPHTMNGTQLLQWPRELQN
jgi:ADP-heptose:LPS heptosyltransferase